MTLVQQEVDDVADKIRAGIVGLDHWYAGLDALRIWNADPRVELVAVAHRNTQIAESVVRATGAVLTADYRAVVERDDIDLILTACTTAENADLCIRAARSGKNIVSIKPFAMNIDEARAIGTAVNEAGVLFLGHECRARVAPVPNPFREAINNGRIGRPINVIISTRYPLPTQVWPDIYGRTWWLDPSKVVGGGWMDHAIYWIDELRYVLGSEPIRISGEINNIQHRDELFEDYGVANIVFGNGCTVTLEVTWTALPAANVYSMQLVGTNGQMAMGLPGSDEGVYEAFDGEGFHQVALSGSLHGSVVQHAVDCLVGDVKPAASFGDVYQNLRVCLAFYEAASQHTVVTL